MICIGASVHPHRSSAPPPEEEEKKPVVTVARRMESAALAPLVLASGASGRAMTLISLRALRGLLILIHGVLLLFLLPFRWRTPGSDGERAPLPAPEVDGKKSVAAAAIVVRASAAAMAARPPQQILEAATRRQIAIQRVEKGKEICGPRFRREFSIFPTARGEKLFTQSWTPVGAPIKGLVVLMHGLNEHSGRYNRFAKQLNEYGLKVVAMDWIGHGGSDGLHGYVHSLDYAVSDLKAFLEKVLDESPEGLPCFIFGHSTGGSIVLKAVLDPTVEARVHGVVLTSPAVRVQTSHPLVAAVAPLFSLVAPTYQFTGGASRGPPVSRDPEALRDKYSDPLVFTGSVRVRTGYEILCITSYLQQNLGRINAPLLVLHGSVDSVTDPEASRRLYDEASSPDKSIKLYDGLLHDLLFEPEGDEIAGDIIGWLSSRVHHHHHHRAF